MDKMNLKLLSPNEIIKNGYSTVEFVNTKEASTQSVLPLTKSLMNEIANNEITNSFASSKNYVAMEGDNVIATVSSKWLGAMSSNQGKQNHKTQHGEVVEGVRCVSKRYISKFLSLKFPITLKFVGLVVCILLMGYTNIFAMPPYSTGLGTGTSVDPWVIETPQDLSDFANDVINGNSFAGNYFIVTDDIVAYPNTMIGNDTNYFEGNLVSDGCRKITVDLNYLATTQNVGLFSIIGGNGSIKRLIIDGTVNGMGQNTGALAGRVIGNNTLKYVTNYANVTGGQNVGGVIGAINAHNVCTLICLANNGNVSGYYAIAGVVGVAHGYQLFVEHCKNSGVITSPNEYPEFMSGIIGEISVHNLEFFGAVNIGKILSRKSTYAGGIIAKINVANEGNGNIFTVINSGIVDGAREMVGGVLGASYNVVVTECINTNWVERGTAGSFGSIVGFINNIGLITNCFYDNQMSIIRAVNNQNWVNVDGRTTANMTNGSLATILQSSGNCWIFTQDLYPMFCSGIPANPIDILAAAPIFIASGQDVSYVTSNFTVSQIYILPTLYLWGKFTGAGIYQPVSVNGNIDVVNGVADINSSGQDSLVVRLDSSRPWRIAKCNVPSDKFIEKWVPINVTACYDTILANTDGNGRIEPSGNVIVPCNKDTTFYFEPDFCYEVDEVLVDDVVVNDYVVGSNEYTIHAYKGIKQIKVTFKKSKFEVLGIVTSTDNYGKPIGGTIEPTIDSVLCDDSVKFVIKPDDCYEVESILVNSDSVKNVSNVSLNPFWVYNVTEPLKVEVAFKKIKYTINAKAENGGEIKPSGDTVVNCGDTVIYTFIPDSCYVVDKVIVNGNPVAYDTAKSSYTFNGVYKNSTIEVTFVDTCKPPDTCIYTLVRVYRDPNGTAEKTNASTVEFMIMINPIPSPVLDFFDFEVNKGTVINFSSSNNPILNLWAGAYHILVDVSSLDGCSDTVRVVRIKDCWLKNTVVNPNEFYDVRRKFCTKGTLINPACDTLNADTTMNGATILLNEPAFANTPNPIRIILKSNNGSSIVNGTLTSSTTITFNYNGLLADTWYEVCILPNSLKDAWNNTNDTICLCSIKTIPDKPCIDSIVRHDPANPSTKPKEKTNATEVTFKVYFSDDVIPNNFIVSGGNVVDISMSPTFMFTLAIPAKVWYVKVAVDSNTTEICGVEVKITGSNSNVFNFCNPTPNESYNVRHEFLATKEFEPKYVHLGGLPYKDTTLKIIFNDCGEIMGELKLPLISSNAMNRVVVSIGNNLIETTYESDTLRLGTGQFSMGLSGSDRTVTDEWGNSYEIIGSIWNFSVAKLNLSDGLTSADALLFGSFAISNINPNPTVDEAEFTINIFEEGNLNVTFYDLSGSFIMNIISDRFMNANTELRVPMSLGMLSSGTYTIMISMGNNIMMRQIIIVK